MLKKCITLMIFSCACQLAVASAINKNEQANILFILTDDQSFNTINAHGNLDIATPNLDSLAKRGMSFSHAFNQGSYSAAVCAPSRRMLNTGRNLYSTGLGGNYGLHSVGGPARKKAKKQGKQLPPEAPMVDYPLWGETFRQAGYKTFMTGKWHINDATWKRSFDHGKAVYLGGMSHSDKGGQWKTKMADYDKNTRKFTKYIGQAHTSELIADAAIDHLNNEVTKSDQPFFMYVAFLAPHDPRQSPQSFVDKYPGEKIPLPANYLPQHPFDQGDYKIRDEKLLPFPRTETAIKSFIGEYYAMIEHVDAQIGRVLTALEKSGKADNTYIVFTSDHGLAVGQHGLLGKQNLYEHSVRAPYIVSGPGIKAGVTKPGMFYLNSSFATTAELAGIDVPDTVQAPSLVPLLMSGTSEGEKQKLNNSIYGAYKTFQRMIRDDRYKLIFYPEEKRQQLFDLENDPMETNDLSNLPEYANVIKRLQGLLVNWQGKLDDRLSLDF